MKNFSLLIAAARVTAVTGACLTFLTVSYASNESEFIGPTVRLNLNNMLTETVGTSLSADAGIKNYRVNGTLGWGLSANDRLKITADYLHQKNHYVFASDNPHLWIDQYTFLGAYQHDFVCSRYQPSLNINGYAGFASRLNQPDVVNVLTFNGITAPYLVSRRVANSNEAGMSVGLSISPSANLLIGADLNYDDVRYGNDYSGTDHDARGFGGTIRMAAVMKRNLTLNLSAAERQPFNNFAASLDWTHFFKTTELTLGFGGNYLVGRNSLPDNWNVGLSFNFIFSKAPVFDPAAAAFLYWVSNKQDLLPTTLAIADEKISPT